MLFPPLHHDFLCLHVLLFPTVWLRRRAPPAGAVWARSMRLEGGREACANERWRNVAWAASSVPQDILSTPEVHINVVAVVPLRENAFIKASLAGRDEHYCILLR